MTRVSLTINGETVSADVEPRTSLADFLRGAQGLTGTHIGCEHGVCGACTVMIDESPARSCITYAVQMDGRRVRTIEGYDDDPVMADLRAEFSKQHALQCGFCTPGMLITARDIVTRVGNPGELRVREELAGNLCRCTGYAGIVQAVLNVGSNIGSEEILRDRDPVTPAPVLVLPEDAEPRHVAAEVAPPSSPAGMVVVEDSVLIGVPLERLWAFFHDLPAVAACLPGAQLSSHDAERWTGAVQIKMGPIRAEMAGKGSYRLIEATHAGRLEGGGTDRNSASRVTGSLDFSLAEEGVGTTKLKLLLSYSLRGPLAQFSRSSLAKEFVRMVVRTFSENVAATLQGDGRRHTRSGLGRILRVLLAALWRRG